jgi:ubiquinone/menaquinone biosynthesis C-methylase UbiE
MDYYDEISEGYGELHNEEQSIKARIILNRIQPKPEDKLLDVGCGDASYLDLFHCKALGIDPSKELLRKYKGGHKLIQGSAEKLPFKDGQFDIVISVTAIHNFTDIEVGLKEMNRVCNGRLALSVLKRSPKAEWIDYAIRKQFKIIDVVEEDKDTIYFCTKKNI